jgi:hypothetical protein
MPISAKSRGASTRSRFRRRHVTEADTDCGWHRPRRGSGVDNRCAGRHPPVGAALLHVSVVDRSGARVLVFAHYALIIHPTAFGAVYRVCFGYGMFGRGEASPRMRGIRIMSQGLGISPTGTCTSAGLPFAKASRNAASNASGVVAR